MKKFLTMILGIMLIMTCLLPCAAIAETAGAADLTAPIDVTDVSWLTAYLDFVIVGICLVVGLLMKHCTPINNKYIPLVVAAVGLLVAIWKYWSEGITPIVLLGGLLSGLASTGFHQVFKQLFFVDE